MLLTSGQISMGISSCIVFLFTSLLFLSGYVLQQQTVRSIQAAIKPRTTAKPHAAVAPVVAPLASLRPDDAPPPKVKWDRLAYVKVATTPESICESLLIYAELGRQGSRADRVLLYPRAWDKGHGGGATAQRLMGFAMDKYGVKVWPIDPVGKNADPLDKKSYPLATLLALTHYNVLLTLTKPSLILHREPLDDLLAEAPESPVSILDDSNEIVPALMLMRPSLAAYTSVIAGLKSSASTPELPLLRKLSNPPDVQLDPQKYESIVLKTGGLGTASSADSDIFQTAGITVFDDEDAPSLTVNKPKSALKRSGLNKEEQAIWEGLRDRFQSEWQSVCGLELSDVAPDDMRSEEAEL